MDEMFYRRYIKLLEVLPDIADCANDNLILVGGTALALFHLKHRISIDLDFVPIKGDDAEIKKKLKGCMTKKGYTTKSGVYKNQFIIQFEDTSIKIEVFTPSRKIEKFEKHSLGIAELKVASIDEIFKMKIEAYKERKEPRDLFDCVFIMKYKNDFSQLESIIKSYGLPENIQEMKKFVLREEDYEYFVKVITDASKTGNKP